MGELLIILWVTIVLTMCSGFVLGYLLGKARTVKYYEKHALETQIMIDDIIEKEYNNDLD